MLPIKKDKHTDDVSCYPTLVSTVAILVYGTLSYPPCATSIYDEGWWYTI